MATTNPSPSLPIRPIPGSYGLPVLGPLKDRLDYFWLQGPEAFFRHRMAQHRSTVFRTNVPPTFPFFLGVNPNVVALVDCRSFPTLFDTSLVSKSNVLVGDYMPSLAFTGNTRVLVYRDPTEAGHAEGKGFCLELLKRGGKVWAEEVVRSADEMMEAVRKEVEEEGKGALSVPLQMCILRFLSRAILGADLDDFPEIKEGGLAILHVWLSLQLLPITKVGLLPQPLEELLLHSFPFPFFPISWKYSKLVDFVKKGGKEAIKLGKEYGLAEDEAIHNILFILAFNAFGGFSVFFPSLFTTISKDNNGLQQRIREEVRNVLAGDRALGFNIIDEMKLVKSTVYEILRLNPPVPLQYGRARKDFVLSSHDSSYKVEKGELLCGYQPLAMRDLKVFEDPEAFVPERFMGDTGEELLNYLFWSNGPETGKPTVENKQCAAKDYVVGTACIVVARIFSTYDSFEVDESLTIVKLEKATSP